jgi:hypothetical protein
MWKSSCHDIPPPALSGNEGPSIAPNHSIMQWNCTCFGLGHPSKAVPGNLHVTFNYGQQPVRDAVKGVPQAFTRDTAPTLRPKSREPS